MSRAQALQSYISDAPIASALGMRCEVHGDQMTAVLPFQKHLIGNYAIQALHGGAISSFLELVAAAQVFLKSDLERPPKPIDLTVNYLRQGHAKDLYAQAEIVKLGRRIASVRAVAWQDEYDKPVTTLNAHFLVG